MRVLVRPCWPAHQWCVNFSVHNIGSPNLCPQDTATSISAHLAANHLQRCAKNSSSSAVASLLVWAKNLGFVLKFLHHLKACHCTSRNRTLQRRQIVFELSFISGQQIRYSLLSHRVDEHLALGSEPLRLFFLGYILVTNKPYFFGFHWKFLMLLLILFRLRGGWLL